MRRPRGAARSAAAALLALGCSATHAKPADEAWPNGQMPAAGETGPGPIPNPRGSIKSGQCSGVQAEDARNASDPLLLIHVASTRTKQPLECVHVAVVPASGGPATQYSTDATGSARAHLPAGDYKVALVLTADCAWCRLDGDPPNVALTAAGQPLTCPSTRARR
jgi:hypothetical protein